ncbi:hypothetical protein EW026_g7641, partial [Hermanssonia centrifuga]
SSDVEDEDDCEDEERGVDGNAEDAEEGRVYKIAKKAPFPRTTVATIVNGFGASNFVKLLNDFLHNLSPHVMFTPINDNTALPVFKQFKIPLPMMS